MANYVKEQNGYVADVPNVYFKRCDGKLFYYDELTAASLTPNNENFEITGGQGLYPLAFIPSGNSLEAQFTSAQFNMNLFEMANATSAVEEADFLRYKSTLVDVSTNAASIRDASVIATSVQINGLTLTDEAPKSGEFKAQVSDGSLNLTFFAGDIADGTTIRIMYQATEAATTVDVLTDSASARGELTMEWPVYSSGTDCTESSTKGFVVATVYRARITTLPGFDSSYKSASTNSITMSALDPKRADKKMYSVRWVPAA